MHAIQTVSFAFILFYAVGVLTPSLAATPKELADDLYKSLAAGKSLIPHIDAIFQAAGIAKLPANATPQTIKAVLTGRNPVLFPGQPALLERLIKDDKLTDLDSFLNEMNARGYRTKGTGAPLSPEILASRWSYLKGKTKPTPPEVLPALLIELAAARVKQSEALKVDAAWGDGQLDSVQYTLLHYAMTFLAAPKQAAAVEAAAVTANLGKLKEVIDFVKNVGGDVEDTICWLDGSNSLSATSKVAPQEIWHQQAAAQPPYRSSFTVQLSRTAHPSLLPVAVTKHLKCEPPPVGSLPGIPITFSLGNNQAFSHGNYEGSLPTKTDKSGKAEVKYRAIKEKVPPKDRTANRKRSANADLVVKVSGWYPDFPRLSASLLVGKVKVNYYSKGGWKGTIDYYTVTKMFDGLINSTNTEFFHAYLEQETSDIIVEASILHEYNNTTGSGCSRSEYKGQVKAQGSNRFEGEKTSITILPVVGKEEKYNLYVGAFPLVLHSTASGGLKSFTCGPPPQSTYKPLVAGPDKTLHVGAVSGQTVTMVNGHIDAKIKSNDGLNLPFFSSETTLEVDLEQEEDDGS